MSAKFKSSVGLVVAVLIVAGCRYVDVGGVEPFTFTERESVEPAAKHGGGCSLHIYSFEGVGRGMVNIPALMCPAAGASNGLSLLWGLATTCLR